MANEIASNDYLCLVNEFYICLGHHSLDGEVPCYFLIIVVAHTKPYDKPYTTLCCGHKPSGIHIIC